MNRSTEILLGTLTGRRFAPGWNSALRPRFRGSMRQCFREILSPSEEKREKPTADDDPTNKLEMHGRGGLRPRGGAWRRGSRADDEFPHGLSPFQFRPPLRIPALEIIRQFARLVGTTAAGEER